MTPFRDTLCVNLSGLAKCESLLVVVAVVEEGMKSGLGGAIVDSSLDVVDVDDDVDVVVVAAAAGAAAAAGVSKVLAQLVHC